MTGPIDRQRMLYDVRDIATLLDQNSRPARYGSVSAVIVVIALALALPAFLHAPIDSGTLSPTGWIGLVMVWGFTVILLLQSRYLLWGARRAATSVILGPDCLVLGYPEGRQVTFSLEVSGPKFDLYDATDAPPSRKALPTAFFLGDHERLSAIPEDAYRTILAWAREKGVVTPLAPKRAWLSPGLSIPTGWAVAGRPE